MTWLPRLAIALSLSVVSGCAMSENLSLRMECTSNDDCAQGQACFFAQCVDSGDSLTEVYIDLSPPVYSSYVPHMDPESPRDLSSGASQLITLESAVDASFTVTTASEQVREGTLTATRKSGDSLAGLPSSKLSYLIPAGQNGGRLAMRSGEYDVRYEPSGTDAIRPPMSWASTEVTGSQAVSLSYPEDASMMAIEGTLTWAEYLPIAGAAVQAFGRDDNTHIISSEGLTQSDGSFELLLPGPLDTLDLALHSASGDGAIPTVRFANVSTTGPIILSAGHTLEYVVAEFNVVDMQGEAIADAAVQLEGEIWNDDGSLAHQSLSVRTDTTGYARAEVLVGSYQVTVIPPRATNSGIRETSLCLGAIDQPGSDCQDSDIAGAFEFVCPAQARISGIIRSAAGEPIADTRVSFVPTKAWPRQVDTVTDDQGRYAVSVDPAAEDSIAYDLIVEPPVSAAAPMHRVRVNVGQDSFDLDVDVPRATFVNGLVHNGDGQPVANVGVSFYSTPSSENDPPWLIGYGLTNDVGEYVVALPLSDETLK